MLFGVTSSPRDREGAAADDNSTVAGVTTTTVPGGSSPSSRDDASSSEDDDDDGGELVDRDDKPPSSSTSSSFHKGSMTGGWKSVDLYRRSRFFTRVAHAMEAPRSVAWRGVELYDGR